MTLAPLFLCLVTGCTSLGDGGLFTPPWKKAPPKDIAPKDSLTIGSGGPSAGGGRELIDPTVRAELDSAQRLLQEKKFAEAEKIFHKYSQPDTTSSSTSAGVTDQPISTPSTSMLAGASAFIGASWSGKYRGRHPRIVYEEALFGEAECQREQKNLREAANTYTKLMVDFPHTQYTRPCCKAIFEIANHWLRPTAAQMDEYYEKLQGKRSFVMPLALVNFSREMPFSDAEGHAINLLNTVRLYDINGPLAEQALWCLGTIQFYRKDYKEADFYFRQVYEQYPNSDFAARAVKQSVICKQLISGDTVYDSRSVEESKKLILQAQGVFPELRKDEKWIATQLASLNIHQADRDYKVAEFYERTGHPGSAYFYYELVCRRYGGTQYAEKATQKKALLKSKAEQDHRRDRSDAQPPAVTSAGTPELQAPIPVPGPRTLPPAIAAPQP